MKFVRRAGIFETEAAGGGICEAAPGYRDAGNNKRFGDLMRVGSNGSCWSSAFSEAYSVFLHLDTQNFASSYVTNCGHGLQLRCLSE